MHVRNFFIAAVTASLVGAPAPRAFAADSPAATGSIHASGMNEITVPPQKVRLALVVRAEGIDAKSAIAALVQHKEHVRKELLEMKADEASIVLGGPKLSHGIPGMPAEWTSYQTRIFLQSAGSNGAKEAARAPQVYTATANVSAEWQLPTGDIDALALLPETLREQIDARDLVGSKNKATLDKAKQEMLEELQAKMRENYAASTDDSEQFTVAFIGHVDDKAREQSFKAAYDRAVARATLMAGAAGAKLGELVSVKCEELPASNSEGSILTQAAMMSGVTAGPKVRSANDEDPSGMNAGELAVTTKVDVEFAIAK